MGYDKYVDMARECKRNHQLCPKAKVVLATSTPIYEAYYEVKRHRFFSINENI